MIERPIERVHAPSPREFRRRWVARKRPVVVTGVMDDWPAMSRWTPQALAERYADREVWTIPVRRGEAQFDPTQGVPYERMRVDDYVAGLAAYAPGEGRYMIFRVGEQLPELLDDVRKPVYSRDAPWQRERFWFAPPDAGGVLHSDLPENLYAQVHGRKRWLLVDRRSWWRVDPYPPWSGVPNYARASAEHPDDPRHPRMRGATVHTATLEPGEMLYIPSLWWHQARSVTTSISVNLWWAEGALLALVRAAEAFMKLRRLSL